MRRWSGIAGIVFVVLALVSRFVRGSLPDSDTKDALAKFTRFYSDKTHNDHALIAAVVGFLALFAFGWFLAGLWSAVRHAEGATTMPVVLVVAGGSAYIALGMIDHILSEGLGVTLKVASGYTIDHGFDPGLAIVLDVIATGAFMAAMLAVGLATAGTAIVIMRTKVFPVWLAWIGIAIAVLSLPAIPPISFLAAVLLAIWVVVISGLMIAQPEPSPS